MKRILVIQTASLGDVILATPIVEKLHKHYPTAKIDFLLKYGYEGVLRKHPYIHHVIVWDKTEKKYKHLIELIRIFREKKYDLIINAQRFFSSGLITVLSGAKYTIGFNKNPLSFLFSRRVKHIIGTKPGGPHETERNLRLISHLKDNENYSMKLYPLMKHEAKVSQFKMKQYITVSPASLWFTKQFPKHKWVDFIKSLDENLMVYLLGSPGEMKLCDEIRNESKHASCMNLAGKLTFLESATLMKDALMNYVNDSAPMHMASAVNAPVTAVYCSTVPEFGFGPLSEESNIVQAEKELKCKPCGLHGFNKCPKNHFNCALLIKNDQLTKLLN